MVIKEFAAQNFRNYKECFVTLSDRINVFIGNNGQGKTNLAEGIYFLSHLSSFRTHRLEHLLTFGEEAGALQGTVVKSNYTQKTKIELTRHGRRVWLDGQPISILSSYITLFYSLIFNPDSLYNYRRFPHERRASFDRFISFMDNEYLAALRDFRKIHSQKNRLLKTGDLSSLADWNHLFIEKGRVIIKKRIGITVKINNLFPELYRRLTGNDLALRLEYTPSLSGNTEQDAKTLALAEESEQRAGHALHGPHRDDFQMVLEERKEAFFSQGEYRISLLALKMAMNDLLSEAGGFLPVIILDDLYSELDGEVGERLSGHLRSIPNQVFITTTHPPGEFGLSGEQIVKIQGGRIV